MRSSVAKLLSILCLASADLAFKPNTMSAVPPPRFPTATGRIVYRIVNTGPEPMNGTITMTWIQDGQKFRQDVHLDRSTAGRDRSIKVASIFDGKALYTILPDAPGTPKTARRQAIRIKLRPDYLSQVAVGMSAQGARVNAGRVVGRGVVLGKPCIIRVSNINTSRGRGSARLWMWRNLPLRAEMNIQIKAPNGTSTGAKVGAKVSALRMSLIATAIDTVVQPAPSVFRLPPGLKIIDVADTARRR